MRGPNPDGSRVYIDQITTAQLRRLGALEKTTWDFIVERYRECSVCKELIQ